MKGYKDGDEPQKQMENESLQGLSQRQNELLH